MKIDEEKINELMKYLDEHGVCSLIKVFRQIHSMTGYGEIRIEIRNNAIYRVSVTQTIKPHIDLEHNNDV